MIKESIILGIIQGITEFLPVSSSAHLVLAQAILKVNENNLLLDTTMHLATALAIAIIFWRDILELGFGLFSSDKAWRKTSWKYALFIIVGSIPAGLAGVLLKDFFEARYSTPHGVGLMLIITAVILFLSAVRRPATGSLTIVNIIAIGLAQAVAILPGISRSGSTISMALICGVDRKEAGRFSFLLGLPAILGAGLLQLKDVGTMTIAPSALFVAFGVSLVVGIISLKLLLGFINRGQLYWFGFYCAVVGIISLVVYR